MMPITVRKLLPDGTTDLTWDGQITHQHSDGVQIEAVFLLRDRIDFGYVVFEKGDVFRERFFTDRWYAIFAIHSHVDNSLKGWYCNISRPVTITETEIQMMDLALDVWVDPDGACTVLDEDEFAALAVSDAEKQNARAAVEEIQQLARAHKLGTLFV